MLLQETKIRLSKAIFLRDAFTGEPVSAGIRIHSLSGGRMEKKAGGYFLFLDVDSSEFEIQVESPIYQSRKLWLKKDCGVEVEEVFMYPSPSYPLRSGDTVIRGRTKPGSLIRFHLEDERGSGRLIGDYKKGEPEISFYNKGATGSGIWHIREKKKIVGEYFRVKCLEDDTERYALYAALASDYQKKDTVIFPAQESIVDEKGEFYLLLGNLTQEVSMLHYVLGSANEEETGTTEIIRGKENLIVWKED